jgi:tetratricopeptide (TPR) repeat protein
MHHDARGLVLTTESADAAWLFDRAVTEYLEYRKSAMATLKQVIAADPDFCLAHCLTGYLFMLFGSHVVDGKVDAALAQAERTLPRVTLRERKHVAALSAWRKGDTARAIRIWDEILIEHPHDLLTMRLQHFALFWSGQSYFMRDAVARAVGAWDAAMPGYGNVLGMYAFGLEECGDYAAAEPKGRRAVELSSDDLWAVHAVAHVLEMQGRLEEGTSFLAQPYGTWDDRNPFRQHLWWHTALFPLELGQYDRVLELYDRAVRAELTDFYLDIQNAASMLFRLEWCGVDAGRRWSELADIAERRIDDHVMAFTDLHFMLALCRDGRLPKAEQLIASFRAFASTPENDAASTMEPVAIPVAEAMLAYTRGDYGAAVDRLVASRYRWPVVGASHAQRDLFSLLLIAAAEKSGRPALARALLAERVELKPHSVASWLHYGDALDKLGDQAAVAARERAANEARRVAIAARA